MAIIQRKIENLKPGKEYILTVRSKNADLNISSDYAESIRFQVPTDQTIPGTITGFSIVANFQKVMFIFNPNNDADLKGYYYELYNANTTSPGNLAFSGFSESNIFTIAVDNTTKVTNNSGATPAFTTITTQYWGRVRMVDTSGNLGPWSNLETSSGATPLLTEQFIDELTASKITAGTIGAHTITLLGGTSIIKSSTFNGVVSGDPAGGLYTGATTGWLITGNGKAYFYDASIAGSIDIGGFDSTSFHVDTTGNVWAGDGAYASAPFRVSSTGVVRVGAGASALYINNNGAITIGAGIGSGPFQVFNDGSLQIGTSPNLFKIYQTGVVEIGQASTNGSNSLWVNNNGSLNMGTSLGTGNFVVQSTGQVDIGGNDISSLHIDNAGNMWSGADSSSFATAPFKLTNDGSLDVGGNDATSLHISAAGDVFSGTSRSTPASAPFYLTASTGSIKVGAITGSYSGFGVTSALYLNDTMYIGNNLIRGSDSGNIDAGLNFYLRASTGFTGRSGTTVLISIGPSGISVTGLPITTTGDVTGNQLRATSNGSAADPSLKFATTTDGFYTDGTDPYWSNGGTGYVIYSSRNFDTSTIWRSTNDGSGSGLDADKVDGLQASSFLRSDATDTSSGTITAAGFTVSSGSFIESSGNLQINSGGTAAYFNNSNGGTLGKLSSSLRYKENVKAIENEELDPKNLLQANIYQFNYKDEFLLDNDKGRGVVFPGFIVEELVEIYPKAVAIDDEGRPDGWNPNYIIPPMLQLIKDLYSKIEELEAKING